jgi:uncharacterized protein
VTARRRFEGSIPLSSLPRLAASLAGADGHVQFEVEFGRDTFGAAFLDVRVNGSLTLICQRTLSPFAFPVEVQQRLGLVARESEEASLPPGYEALVLPDGELRLADVIEDELILALPVVPLSPAAVSAEPAEVVDGDVIVWHADPDAGDGDGDEDRVTPFAALAGLKKPVN